MKNLKADVRFLIKILAKVNNTSFVKQQEGVEMLRAQISHMQKRHLTTDAPDSENGAVLEGDVYHIEYVESDKIVLTRCP